MNRSRTLAVIGVASLALAGCFSSGPKETTGTVVGAITGGVIGGATSGGSAGGVAAGALIGGLLGNVIGADLDAADRRAALDAEYRALEYGRPGAPVQWRGNSGHYGDVVAGAQYRVNDYNCRDYTHTIYIDGEPQVARGTACRQTDGTWQPVG